MKMPGSGALPRREIWLSVRESGSACVARAVSVEGGGMGERGCDERHDSRGHHHSSETARGHSGHDRPSSHEPLERELPPGERKRQPEAEAC